MGGGGGGVLCHGIGGVGGTGQGGWGYDNNNQVGVHTRSSRIRLGYYYELVRSINS